VADWAHTSAGAVQLIHDRTRHVIAGSVELALNRRARRIGLLGRTGIEATEALVLAPCFAVHTAFMRFPIDVLFVDRYGRALRVVHTLKPWRAAVSTPAYAAVELAAGVLGHHGVMVGDHLHLELAAPDGRSVRLQPDLDTRSC